jgi:CDP-diacylglycerol---glycerol-3-phosphate 3-phosphatidyltransferase
LHLFNLPNILTLSRIGIIPFFVAIYYSPLEMAGVWASVIFILAAITDAIDGYLARRWQQTTALGAFLDPVADKLIVTVALIMLVHTYADLWLTLAAMIIISREIIISALREWMAELGLRAKVAVSWLGKVKTASQMLAIILLLYQQPLVGIDLYLFGILSLWAAAVLSLWSMYIYLIAALPEFNKN